MFVWYLITTNFFDKAFVDGRLVETKAVQVRTTVRHKTISKLSFLMYKYHKSLARGST